MMKNLIAATLVAGAALAHAQTQPAPTAPTPTPAPAAPSSPAKKELVQRLLALQQPGIESLARTVVEQPAAQMMQAAARALQTQVAPEKREAVGKTIEGDVKKYVDESLPPMRDKALKLAPSTIGVLMEERFSEDELKQLLAWFESPLNKKYVQLGPEMNQTFMQKLIAEARPVLDPKLQALEQKVRTALGVPSAPAGAASAAPAAPASRPAAKGK